MSNGNQSYLRFSLEESVWFQKGQEVDELISISLDPNISIQESDQYVTIKGSLNLSGEYNRDEDSEEEYDDLSNPRTVRTVEVREDGLHLFIHEFPVEVTIPKNRIQDLNDIDVTVESFDYAFPEKSCIRLSADLMITGLYGELQHEFYEEQEEELVEIETIYREPDTSENEDWNYSASAFNRPEINEEEQMDLYSPFEVEARKNPLESVEENNATEQEETKLEEPISRSETVVNQTENTIMKNTAQDGLSENEIIESTTQDDFVLEEEQNIGGEEQALPFEEEYPEITYGSNQNEAPNAESEADQDIQEEGTDDHEEPKSEEKNKKNKWKNKKSLTLSEFFARKSEEDHTKLKMCIVQNGETLEILSERYDVPVSHLQRVNGMELNQDIYEGQVLYIPVSQMQR